MSDNKPKLLKKITVKTVCGTMPKKEIPDEGEARELMLVYGEVRRMKSGTTEFGEYVAFKGSFEAVNIADGEVFRAMNLILPQDGQDMLEEVMSSPGIDTARFAFKISVVGDTTNIGYHYQVEHVTEAGQTDPLAEMRASLIESKAHPALKALPAAKPESAPTPVVEEEKKKTANARK